MLEGANLIQIFARAPVLGQTKRRLASELGRVRHSTGTGSYLLERSRLSGNYLTLIEVWHRRKMMIPVDGTNSGRISSALPPGVWRSGSKDVECA